MTDNRAPELREKLHKLIIELDRLDIALDVPASNMTLGEYEHEREKLLDGFMQAIAATLGRTDCHVKAIKKMGDMYGIKLSCGHSMVNPFNDPPDFCPWCGRKVVDE